MTCVHVVNDFCFTSESVLHQNSMPGVRGHASNASDRNYSQQKLRSRLSLQGDLQQRSIRLPVLPKRSASKAFIEFCPFKQRTHSSSCD